jgi:hypothetical protein
MKVKCIQDTYDETHGLFHKTTTTKKVDGITEGKVYSAEPVSMVNGSIGNGYGDVSTQIRFFIFDDNCQWLPYSTKYFVPAEL